MKVGILALQGAFLEHEKRLRELGAECVELRQRKDLESGYDALVLPGGESTVQGKLLYSLSMFQPLKEQIESGMPVLATCAGMILLAETVEDQKETYLSTLPMTVKRNAYGRQLGSFHTEETVKGIGKVPMTFIRAPYIVSVKPGAEVLSTVNGKIVGVQYGNQLAFSFHPELDEDKRLHQYFLDRIH